MGSMVATAKELPLGLKRMPTTGTLPPPVPATAAVKPPPLVQLPDEEEEEDAPEEEEEEEEEGGCGGGCWRMCKSAKQSLAVWRTIKGPQFIG